MNYQIFTRERVSFEPLGNLHVYFMCERFNMRFLQPFQCLDITEVCLASNMIKETLGLSKQMLRTYLAEVNNHSDVFYQNMIVFYQNRRSIVQETTVLL